MPTASLPANLGALKLASVPGIFGETVANRLTDILNHQQPNGSIILDPKRPDVYPQQSIMPLAFCWAGLDPNRKWKHDPRVADTIRKLGAFLLTYFNDAGEVTYDSYGYLIKTADQRLTYAWLEALNMLRQANADHDYDKWSKKITAACENLVEHRLRKLLGVRRFIVRVVGTGTNHMMLYAALVYRAGQILNRSDFTEIGLSIGKAMANDVHPDGYWDEHSDLLRTGGPTPAYNYISFMGCSLFAAWSGDPVFKNAVEKGARFISNFLYPDGSFVDLIDERVRLDLSPRHRLAHYDNPRLWGLFGLSGTSAGRGSAALHMAGWLSGIPEGKPVNPESLARLVENHLYWQSGPIAPPPTDNPNHRALMTLPAGIFRRGPWCIGLSAIRSFSTEDDAYKNNPFTLDRQKLFSVWHERVGLVIDGSNSKRQPENSTFAAAPDQGHDYYCCGGEIGVHDGDFVAKGIYKTFIGTAAVALIDDDSVRIRLTIDPVATNGPFTAGFTLRMLATTIAGLKYKAFELNPDVPFAATGAELGGGFTFGPVTITGPDDFKLSWPLSPFNSYAADGKSYPEASIPLVSVTLTPSRPTAEFILRVENTSRKL